MFLLTFSPSLTWTIGIIRCVAQWKLTDIAADFSSSAILDYHCTSMIFCIAQWKLTCQLFPHRWLGLPVWYVVLHSESWPANFFPITDLDYQYDMLYCTVKADLPTFSPSLTWTTSMICCIAQWKLTDVSADVFHIANLDYQYDTLYCTLETFSPVLTWTRSITVKTDWCTCRLFPQR